MSDTQANTKVIVNKRDKSVVAALLLTLIFGPLGLLYASIGGAIFLIIIALILGAVTAGIGALIAWPLAMIWALLAALASKGDQSNAT